MTSAILFAAVATASIAGGIHLIVLARGTFRTWLALIRTPTAKIGEAESGLVELVGRVAAPAKPLIDPVSERPCVYYHHADKQGHCDFLIDDGTGVARLELDGALVAVKGYGDLVIEPGDEVYAIGPATRLPAEADDGARLVLRATRKRTLFVAELAEQTASRRLGLRAAAALTLGALMLLLGVGALVLEAWLLV